MGYQPQARSFCLRGSSTSAAFAPSLTPRVVFLVSEHLSEQYYLVTKYHICHYPKLVPTDIENRQRAFNEIRLPKDFLHLARLLEPACLHDPKAVIQRRNCRWM